jgi:hypothetical protein
MFTILVDPTIQSSDPLIGCFGVEIVHFVNQWTTFLTLKQRWHDVVFEWRNNINSKTFFVWNIENLFSVTTDRLEWKPFESCAEFRLFQTNRKPTSQLLLSRPYKDVLTCRFKKFEFHVLIVSSFEVTSFEVNTNPCNRL